MALWSLKGKKILVVDDFPEMRSMMRSMVAAYGADNIEQARNGEEALERMQSTRFDIILCDYNLGEGKDGQQVLEEAKYRELLPYSTVFIMVTAENTQEMVMGALEFQPDAYLSKPVTKTVLQVRLKKIMEKKESLRKISVAMQNKEYARAIKLCEAALSAGNKHRFELLKLESDLLVLVGDYDRAEAICKEVMAERELPWALLNLGKVYYYRGEDAEAQSLFDRIIEASPSFVAAYDWRARVLTRIGEAEAAQETLMQAVDQSPKSLLRQRALADVAEQNEDYDVTEKARRRAIRVGRGSILRKPRDFTSYAKVLVKNNSAKDALKVVDNIKHEFKADAEAEFASLVTAGIVHGALGNPGKAEQAVAQAMALSDGRPELVTPDAGVDLVQLCLAQGNREAADKMVACLVRNHYEDSALLDEISDVYASAGFKAEADKLISDIADEAVAINNQGVQLAKQGKLQESRDFFARALKDMPNNPVVNLNAAQSLIMMMKAEGATPELVDQTASYIKVAEHSDQHRQWANKLETICRNLAATLA